MHGPGGVGKSALVTRFAHEVAGDYPDGRLYCDLRGVGDVRIRMEECSPVSCSPSASGSPPTRAAWQDLQKLW